MPSLEEIEYFKEIVNNHYPNVPSVCCVMKGLKLLLEESAIYCIHECIYNGWQHDHYVSNVFVFAHTGVIVACSVNHPGGMHDRHCAEQGGVCAKLEEVHIASGGMGVVDSAFSHGHYDFSIKS
jgi:hypothetical protein